MTNEKKNPPISVIMTGYAMIQVRDAFRTASYAEFTHDRALGYLADAIMCGRVAVDDLMKENAGDMNRFKFSPTQHNLGRARRLLRKAISKESNNYDEEIHHLVGRAHKAAERAYLSLGYRPLTKQDFDEHGASGGR